MRLPTNGSPPLTDVEAIGNLSLRFGVTGLAGPEPAGHFVADLAPYLSRISDGPSVAREFERVFLDLGHAAWPSGLMLGADTLVLLAQIQRPWHGRDMTAWIADLDLTIAHAATALGVTEAAVRRWLKYPESKVAETTKRLALALSQDPQLLHLSRSVDRRRLPTLSTDRTMAAE